MDTGSVGHRGKLTLNLQSRGLQEEVDCGPGHPSSACGSYFSVVSGLFRTWGNLDVLEENSQLCAQGSPGDDGDRDAMPPPPIPHWVSAKKSGSLWEAPSRGPSGNCHPEEGTTQSLSASEPTVGHPDQGPKALTLGWESSIVSVWLMWNCSRQLSTLKYEPRNRMGQRGET